MPTQLFAIGEQGGRLLTIADITMSSLSMPASADAGRLDEKGEDQFAIGATLLVPAGEPADVFRAELPVTVYYY